MGNVLHRGKGSFTHVENTIFFDHGLSAKAKGIYCQIRSLEGNPEWVFTIKGFASLVRDGADAVTAGIKELEGAGYIIRARKRSENGRFLKAEEATWITLDDPAMHGEVCAELKADGFAILSEFERGGEPSAADGPEGPAKPPETRETGESPQVGARTGKPVSGKATSGKPAPINYSSDQSPQTDKQLISCDPAPADRSEEKASGDFREYRKGEFPEAFERLCSMSLKPLTSLAFKRDALKAWKAKVVAGFDPEQIVDAYAADGEPLDMAGLAQADPDFAKLWRKVQTRRSVIRSQLCMDGSRPPEERVLELCADDGPYKRYWAACEERYARYLKMCDLFAMSAEEMAQLKGAQASLGFPLLGRGCA